MTCGHETGSDVDEENKNLKCFSELKAKKNSILTLFGKLSLRQLLQYLRFKVGTGQLIFYTMRRELCYGATIGNTNVNVAPVKMKNHRCASFCRLRAVLKSLLKRLVVHGQKQWSDIGLSWD